MELYTQYRTDYFDLIKEIKEKLQNIPALVGDEKRHAVRDGTNALKEAEQLISSMELAARNVTGRVDELLSAIKGYKNETKQLKKDLQQLEQRGDRVSLLGGSDEDAVTSMEQRAAMMSATDRLDRTGNDIKNSKQISLQALESGVGALRNLKEQSERIDHSRSSLRGVNGRLDQAKRVMDRMFRLFLKNKCIQFLIIFVILVIIAVIVYLKWFYTPSTDDTTPLYPPSWNSTLTNSTAPIQPISPPSSLSPSSLSPSSLSSPTSPPQ